MRYESQSDRDNRSWASPDNERRLGPVIARALELGRGPPGLVNWLVRHPAGPDESLAVELNQLIRTAGVTETLAE